jgi:lipopolysaccharide/colanic/teichoic acid biosynthesis glycosyltransferase
VVERSVVVGDSDGRAPLDGVIAGGSELSRLTLVARPPALRPAAPPAPRAGRLKRALDLIGASVGLVLTLPIMAAVAVAIRLDSPGPIFFRQSRCGQGGREFPMLKFRTMVPDAEARKVALASRNEVDGPMFKLAHDPRVTRVGRFLRKTSLDELPQLVNVLRGEMSLVGPRPLAMEEMRWNPSWRDSRLTMRPGLTGLWQVEAHSKAAFADWITHDLAYLRNHSLSRDLRILTKTLLVAALGKNGVDS